MSGVSLCTDKRRPVRLKLQSTLQPVPRPRRGQNIQGLEMMAEGEFSFSFNDSPSVFPFIEDYKSVTEH